MRTKSILRALTLAAALSAPVAQVALADQDQPQQAMSSHNSSSTPTFNGVYDNPANSPGRELTRNGPSWVAAEVSGGLIRAVMSVFEISA